MILTISRGEDILASYTTEDPASHYGQPVYQYNEPETPVATDDTLLIQNSEDDPDDAGSKATIVWTNGIWAIVDIDLWPYPTQAIHLATGFRSRLTLDGAAYSQIDPAIDWQTTWDDLIAGKRGRFGVVGALPDWTGETIGLVFA